MQNNSTAYNRATAVRITREKMGLSSIAPSEWTYEQRVAYNKELAAFIASYPNGFSEEELQTAKGIQYKNVDPLDDVSLMSNLSLFGNEFLVEAEKVINTGGTVLQKSIYIAVVVAVSWYFLPYVWKSISPKGPFEK